MTQQSMFLAAVLALGLAPASVAGQGRHGVGVGYDLGTVELDSPGGVNVDFVGFNLFGKIGITDHWGIFVNYRNMRDDENLAFGEKDSYTQIGAHGAYTWRPARVVRPHVKFGASWTDFEAEIPDSVTLSDSGFGFSLGGGFEAGSPRVAFFLDWEIAEVALDFDEGQSADLTVDDGTLGVIFKF